MNKFHNVIESWWFHADELKDFTPEVFANARYKGTKPVAAPIVVQDYEVSYPPSHAQVQLPRGSICASDSLNTHNTQHTTHNTQHTTHTRRTRAFPRRPRSTSSISPTGTCSPSVAGV